MRYTIDVDDKTGQSTLTIGDAAPVRIANLDLKIEREPVLDEKATREGAGYQVFCAGPRGLFTVSAALDYGPTRQI
jgi:hypothetical protein